MILALLLLAGTLAASVEPAVAALEISSQEADLEWRMHEAQRVIDGTIVTGSAFLILGGLQIHSTAACIRSGCHETNLRIPDVESRVGTRLLQLGIAVPIDYLFRRCGLHKVANIFRVVFGGYLSFDVGRNYWIAHRNNRNRSLQ